jgi:uncharacterized paraquat-inducible protein A
MIDYISRQAALDGLNEQIAYCDKALGSFEISMKDEYAVKVERASLIAYKGQLESIPAADVAPVVHGRWKKKKDSDLFYCSECELPSMHKWPYCERCGAKMYVERKE